VALFGATAERKPACMHCQQASHLKLSCPSELTFVFTTGLPGPVPPPCSPQNISNFLWAFAKLGVKSPDLFVEGAIAEHMCSYHSVLAQVLLFELAVASAFAACLQAARSAGAPLLTSQPNSPRLKCSPSHHSRIAAGRHGARVMHTFTPQSIANMIWAFATLEQCPDGAFLQARGQACAIYGWVACRPAEEGLTWCY